jgi:hypothetical protein
MGNPLLVKMDVTNVLAQMVL